ncbi:hypothetical protein D3C84_1272440 [compost metagenome]
MLTLSINLSFCDFPDFVVIIITPFAAFDPYKDVEEASFKTLILSMSLEFKLLISPA